MFPSGVQAVADFNEILKVDAGSFPTGVLLDILRDQPADVIDAVAGTGVCAYMSVCLYFCVCGFVCLCVCGLSIIRCECMSRRVSYNVYECVSVCTGVLGAYSMYSYVLVRSTVTSVVAYAPN